MDRAYGFVFTTIEQGLVLPVSATIVQLERLGLGVPPHALYRMIAAGTYTSLAYDTGNSGSARTLDWSLGNLQLLTLTANCVLTFSNLLDGSRYLLGLAQDTVGGRTVTWPTIRWLDGATPALTAAPNQYDWVTLWRARGLTFGVTQSY